VAEHGVPFPFHVMLKPHGPVCNLACRYCFYLHKSDMLHTLSRWRMTDEVLEAFTRQYIAAQPEGAVVNFAWQGGEPTLMGLDFFKRAVELQEKYRRPGQRVTNSFQTNGTLVDEAWASFFAENKFLVGVSIDGPRSIHNYYRVSASGEGSFDRVMRSVEIMKAHRVEYNALCCVTNLSPGHALEIYEFLKEHFRFIQFIPIVEEKNFTREAPFLENSPKWRDASRRRPSSLVHSWCVPPEGYGRFLCTVFDRWVRNDVGRVFVQIFEATLARWAGRPPSLCIFSPVCGKALVMEHDGTLYACDHFVYPEYRLGNIMDVPLGELVVSEKQKKFGEDKLRRLPPACRRCSWLTLCAGGCPKNRFVATTAGDPELNYLCPGYKLFFKHTAPLMGTMVRLLARNRPAAEIMGVLRAVEAGKVGRNDPCPCGSGKKYKQCCMHRGGSVSPPPGAGAVV